MIIIADAPTVYKSDLLTKGTELVESKAGLQLKN